MPRQFEHKPCKYIYKDGTQRCKQFSTEKSEFCRAHLFKSKNEKPAPALPAKDDSSTISIEDNVAQDITQDEEPSMELTKQFVFNCIDEYFENQKRRSEYLEQLAGRKRSNDSSMTALLGMGAMGLLPVLLKHFNIADAFNNATTAPKMDRAGEATIQGRAYTVKTTTTASTEATQTDNL